MDKYETIEDLFNDVDRSRRVSKENFVQSRGQNVNSEIKRKQSVQSRGQNVNSEIKRKQSVQSRGQNVNGEIKRKQSVQSRGQNINNGIKRKQSVQIRSQNVNSGIKRKQSVQTKISNTDASRLNRNTNSNMNRVNNKKVIEKKPIHVKFVIDENKSKYYNSTFYILSKTLIRDVFIIGTAITVSLVINPHIFDNPDLESDNIENTSVVVSSDNNYYSKKNNVDNNFYSNEDDVDKKYIDNLKTENLVYDEALDLTEFLNSTDGGYYVKQYCNQFGVDPYLFASICKEESSFDHYSCIPGGDMYNGAGVGLCQIESPDGNTVLNAYDMNGDNIEILNSMDNMVDLESNVKAAVIIYRDNLDRLYYVLSDRYSEYDENLLKEAATYFSIPCYNMGLSAMIYIIDNYDIFNGNEFDFVEFQNGLTFIHNNPYVLVDGWEGLFGNDQYFNKIWSNIPNYQITNFIDDDYYTFNTNSYVPDNERKLI